MAQQSWRVGQTYQGSVLKVGQQIDGQTLKIGQWLQEPGFPTEYSVAATADGTMTNIQEYFPYPSPFGPPFTPGRVPAGSVRRVSLSQRTRIDGVRLIEWEFSAAYFSHLDDYVTTIHGAWDKQESTLHSIRTRFADGNFRSYTVTSTVPQAGEDYEQPQLDKIEDLVLRFRVVSDA